MIIRQHFRHSLYSLKLLRQLRNSIRNKSTLTRQSNSPHTSSSWHIKNPNTKDQRTDQHGRSTTSDDVQRVLAFGQVVFDETSDGGAEFWVLAHGVFAGDVEDGRFLFGHFWLVFYSNLKGMFMFFLNFLKKDSNQFVIPISNFSNHSL